MLRLVWDKNLSATLGPDGWQSDTPTLQALLERHYPRPSGVSIHSHAQKTAQALGAVVKRAKSGQAPELGVSP